MSNSINGAQGQYLYDRYGKVVGVKPEASAQAMKDNYSSNMTQQSKTLKGETWIVWGNPGENSVRTIDEIAQQEPGLLISLFLDGNLTVSELEIGVKSTGGGKDFNVTEDSKTGKTIVTYTDKNGDRIELRCSTEACKSQTDKKTQSNSYDTNIIQGSTKSEAYDPYYETTYSWNGMSQISTLKQGGQEALNANNAQKSQNNKSSKYAYVIRDCDNGNVFQVVPNPNNNLNWKEKNTNYQGYQEAIFNNGAINGIGERYVTVEELSVDQIVSLWGDHQGCQLPTSELEKWLRKNVGGDYTFTTEPRYSNAYYHTPESMYTVHVLRFKYNNKDYEIEQLYNYEESWSYESMEVDYTPTVQVKGKVEVSTAQQLKEVMTSKPDSVIVLKNDIDLKGIDWTPIENFSGILFGAGHTIKNLTVTTDIENAGFVGVLTGIIQDVNFENAKIVNTSGELKSSSGVIAGRMDVTRIEGSRPEGYVPKKDGEYTGYHYYTQIKNVVVKNSTVTGGANTGALVGDAVNPDTTNHKTQITDTKVSGCTVKGSYANGGAIGHSDAINIGTDSMSYGKKNTGSSVSDTVVEGGVFAGGVVGSADNNFYTTTYLKGGAGDGYCQTGARTLNGRIGMSVSNVTVKGEEGVTLAAGGVCGRMNAPDSDTYEKGFGALKSGTKVSGSNVSGAYAEGSYCGWFCEVDPETGKVTKDCDAPLKSATPGQIGRAGTTTDEVMKINAGQYVNIDELFANIDSFAQINNLSHYKNFEHVYQDSKGNLYWNNSGSIMCNTFVNAIEAYKTMKSEEMELHGASISMVYFDGGLEEDKVYAMSGYCDPYHPGIWSVNELLSGLDAVEVYGKDVPYEYCYKTADGQWHKLTMSTVGAYDKDGNDTESIIYDYNSVKDYINQHLAKSVNELDKLHYFAVEDITAEEAMETFGALTGQPPHNQGFVNDGLDGYVEEVKAEKETDLTGITKVETPANATLQDYKDMLALTNFLKADIYSGTTFDTQINTNSGKYVLGKFDKETGEYKGVFSENPDTEYHMIHSAYNSYNQVSKEPYKYESVDHFDVGQTCPDDESCYVDWYYIDGDSGYTKTVSTLNTIGGKVELTEDNLEYYKDKIPFYDKEELVKKVMEKLQSESWKIVAQDKSKSKTDEGYLSNYYQWVDDLITALGVSGFDWTSGGRSRGGGAGGNQSSMCYAHVTFTLNNKTYCIPFASDPDVYDESQIFTKEDVEALRPYLSDEIINDTFYNMNDATAWRGSYYFSPLLSVDGEIQSWLYIGNLAGLIMEGYDSKPHELGREVPIPTARDMDPQVFVNYIKTHDMNLGNKIVNDLDLMCTDMSAETEAADAKMAAMNAQLTAQKEKEDAAKKAEEDKKEREAHSKEFIEKFAKQFVGYDAASSEFTALVSEYKTQYLNGTLSKFNFDSLVNKAFNTVKAKHIGGEEAPTVIMTASKYKAKYMNYVKTLGLSYDEKANAYYKNDTADYITVQKYFLWNPFANNGEGDVLWYQSQFLSSTKSGDQGRVELINKLNAAYVQGLNFTTDPDICTDNSGNIYKYNKSSKKYELKK